ncbi:MAG: hypothetical protein K2M73_09550 [Lachnospiraceae bacterium]|nr:hypothetical protein [Lachnospiraceae bacterium]
MNNSVILPKEFKEAIDNFAFRLFSSYHNYGGIIDYTYKFNHSELLDFNFVFTNKSWLNIFRASIFGDGSYLEPPYRKTYTEDLNNRLRDVKIPNKGLFFDQLYEHDKLSQGIDSPMKMEYTVKGTINCDEYVRPGSEVDKSYFLHSLRSDMEHSWVKIDSFKYKCLTYPFNNDDIILTAGIYDSIFIEDSNITNDNVYEELKDRMNKLRKLINSKLDELKNEYPDLYEKGNDIKDQDYFIYLTVNIGAHSSIYFDIHTDICTTFEVYATRYHKEGRPKRLSWEKKKVEYVLDQLKPVKPVVTWQEEKEQQTLNSGNDVHQDDTKRNIVEDQNNQKEPDDTTTITIKIKNGKVISFTTE